MKTTKKKSLLSHLNFLAKKKLIEKYSIDNKQYRMKTIDGILFNENTHLVTRFKDYLIFDDNNEFISKYYENKEIKVVLPFILEYYINYSKINPSFILNKEGKIIYKNFHKKQKLYLSKHRINDEENNLEIETSEFLFSKYLNTLNKDEKKILEVLKSSIIDITNSKNNEKEESIFKKNYSDKSLPLNGDNFLRQSLILSLLDKTILTHYSFKSTFYPEIKENMETEVEIAFEKSNLVDFSCERFDIEKQHNQFFNKNMNLCSEFNNIKKKHFNGKVIRNINNNNKFLNDKLYQKFDNIGLNKGKFNADNKIFNKKNFLIKNSKRNINIFCNLKNRNNKSILNKNTHITSINKIYYVGFNSKKIDQNKILSVNNDQENTTKNKNVIKNKYKNAETNAKLKGLFNQINFNTVNKNKRNPLIKDTNNYINIDFARNDYFNELNNLEVFSDFSPINKSSFTNLLLVIERIK